MKVVLRASSAVWTLVLCEPDRHGWAGGKWWLLTAEREGADC